MRRAYDLIAEGFGPGTNGPLFVTVEGATATDPEALEAFVATLEGTEDVAFAMPDADQRRARTRHRLPGERPAGREPRRRWSTSCATT